MGNSTWLAWVGGRGRYSLALRYMLVLEGPFIGMCVPVLSECLLLLSFPATPAAKALQAAQPQLSALSKSDLQDVLRYHIVPQALVIPAGLEPGKAYPTAFKGHNLKFKFNK